MATVFTLNASAVPAPIVPSALINIASGAATVAAQLTPPTTALSAAFNGNARRIDALGRAGAGAYAIDWDSNPASAILPGLNLTVSSGLTLAIAAGQAVLDSVVQKTAPTTVTLGNNIARIYLWMDQLGAVTQVNNSLTPPAGAQVFLGSCVTSAGAITQIDGSGVLYFRGGALMRQTADTTTPSDTPPAGLVFFNVGPTLDWIWDGLRYVLISASSTPISLASGGTGATGQTIINPTGNVTLTNPGQVDAGTIEARSGGGVAAPWALTWPASGALSAAYNGRTWIIDNTTGQPLTLVGPDTTQVFCINNARVGVKWDGTTFTRMWYSTPTYFAAVVSGGTYTFGAWSEVDADHMLLTPSGGNTIVVFPSGAALHKRGRRIAIQNDASGTQTLTIKTGGAPVSQQWVLMPGECGDFIIDGAGGINRCDTMSYARRVSITHDDTATYAVIHPDWLGEVLEIGGALTATRNLQLPTIVDKKWFIQNGTGQSLVIKTAAGTGPTLTNGNGMWVYCNAAGNMRPASGYVTTSGLVPVSGGGTNATTAAGARTSLGAAASGANSDITSLTGLTGAHTGNAQPIQWSKGIQAMADANQTPAAAVYQHRYLETTGALTAQRNLTLPTVAESEWHIINSCTGFGVNVKTGAGTGIVVAAGRSATVRGNGTNILRVTADVDPTV